MPYTFVFDFDGTITKEETLPLLAKSLGKGKEMAQRTAQAMQREAPFAPDFLQRLALLDTLPVAQAQQIVRDVACFQEILSFIQRHKKSCLILTGNLDVYIDAFLEKIGMRSQCISSVGTVEDGLLVAVRAVIDKAQVVQALPRPIVCIGDGSNDIGMLARADIGIAFGGAHPLSQALIQVADYTFTEEKELCDFLEQLCQINILNTL